ncbi:hypothetical protein TUM4641_06030 [Shewanella morhuae]|nr:hypothetical protein TUM4641_06030 [Shewanella morhuae]
MSAKLFTDTGCATINQGVRFKGVVVDSSMLSKIALAGDEPIHSHSKNINEKQFLSMDLVQLKKR